MLRLLPIFPTGFSWMLLQEKSQEAQRQLAIKPHIL